MTETLPDDQGSSRLELPAIPDGDDPVAQRIWLTYFDRVVFPALETPPEQRRWERRVGVTTPVLDRPDRLSLGGLCRVVDAAERVWPGQSRAALGLVALRVTDALWAAGGDTLGAAGLLGLEPERVEEWEEHVLDPCGFSFNAEGIR